jgi:hypothetical protein
MLTEKRWKEEVGRALAGAGLPWNVAAAWIQKDSAEFCADVVDQRSGKDRRIRLSGEQFSTDAARRAEIVRQVQRPDR